MEAAVGQDFNKDGQFEPAVPAAVLAHFMPLSSALKQLQSKIPWSSLLRTEEYV